MGAWLARYGSIRRMRHIKMLGISMPRVVTYAIYEYSIVCSDRYMIELNIRVKKRWHDFIKYGIARGKFQEVDIEVITDHILYIYQGIRMWSRVIPIEERTVTGIIWEIRKDLEREEA